jgi:high-affinity nickel-transport protein
MAGLCSFIICLHCLGWGLHIHYASAYPSLMGLGLVAYMFGLRHAFDADHIAAIDDNVRLLSISRCLPVTFSKVSDAEDAC